MKTKIILAVATAAALLGLQVQAQTYNWTTIAGLYNGPGSQDGTNNTAFFNNPAGIAADGVGNIFVADAANYTVRKITQTNGGWVVTTVAGLAGAQDNSSSFADGLGAAARFYYFFPSANKPTMIAAGGGEIYVHDGHYSYPYAIRKLIFNGTNLAVSTLPFDSGISSSGGMAFDFSGNFYTASNYLIQKYTPIIVNGIATTNYTVTPLAGFPGVTGHVDGTNNTARFSSPQVFAVDKNGVVFLRDNNISGDTTMRTVSPSGGNWIVTTLPVPANSLANIVSNYKMDGAGNIYGTGNNAIFLLAAGTTNWVSIGGTNTTGGADGTNSQARFWSPGAVTVDSSGNVYVADSGANTIRLGVNLDSIPLGGLQVNLATDSGTNNSMAWRVDGGSWQTNGAVVSNLQAGSHVVSFAPVYGWLTPTNQLVNLGNNQTNIATGIYVQLFSSLVGSIAPTGAINAGGLWQVDAGGWQTNGAIVSGLTIGSHIVSFTNILGWITPSNQMVNVSPYQQSSVIGNYVALGAVAVSITPGGAISAGAEWSLDGGAWQASGAVVSNVALGTHTVSFAPAGGYITPGNLDIAIFAGQTTVASAIYNIPVAIARQPTNLVTLNGGTATFNVLASGTGPFTYQWQFNGTNINTPPIITTIAGTTTNGFIGDGGTATNAMLNYPAGIVADGTGNFFIADESNNRIRKVDSNGIISTVAGTITNGFSGDNGQATNARMYYPHDVTIDLTGNIYIADQYNHRIRKVTAGGVITTIAGNGTAGYSGDGVAATSASLNYPAGVAVDNAGNIFIADYSNARIRKVTTGGIMSTVAGNGTAGYSGDGGAATSAKLSNPARVAVDSAGNLYIADVNNGRIRKVTTNGVISTVAGGGISGLGDGGAATNAVLSSPFGIAVDGVGNIYIGDEQNNAIRAVNTNGIIKTVAGNGIGGYSGDGSTAANASLLRPQGVTLDYGGNLFIADVGNNRIRKVFSPISIDPLSYFPTLTLNNVTTNSAGNYQVIITGPYGSITSSIATLTVPLGLIGVTINPTNAATGGAKWALDGGAWQDTGVTITNVALGLHTVSYLPLGNWITPSNQVVNVVSGQTTNVTATYTALGSVQVFIAPIGVVSAGASWQVDGGAWQTSGSVVTNLVAGSHTVAFTNITGWTTPSNQTVTVNLNQATIATGVYAQQFGNLQVVLSPAGAVSKGAQWQLDGGAWQASGATLTNVTVGSHTVAYASVAGWTAPTNLLVTINSNQTARLTAIYQGQGSLQVLLVPTGAIVSGAQWQVDGGTWMSNGMVISGLSLGIHTVSYKPASGWVAPANQSVSILANQTTVTNGLYTGLGYNFTTIAGMVGNSAFADGTNFAALFDTPVGICVDVNSNLYIADTGNSVIRKLRPTTNGWISSTIAGLAGYPGNTDGTNSQARFDYPSGVTVDSNGNLFVADQVNSTIRKMTTDGTNWTVSTIAGLAGNYGSANGTNGVARFYYPAGVAVDTAGNVYVADQINSTIRKLTPLASNNWAVTTIAGSAGLNGSTDGTNAGARLYWPSDLTVDASGNLFVADTFNNTIRKVSPVGANYVTTTICGVAGVNSSVDGTNNAALFDGLGGIALDAFGNLFVADSYSSVIRKITPVGNSWVVNTIGGLAYVNGATDGTNSTARFNTPYGVAVNGSGVVFIADTYNQAIRVGSAESPLPENLNVFISPILNAPTATLLSFSFNWLAQSGVTYQVQFKTNLLQPSWLNIGSPNPATNAVMPFTDVAATNGQRFYRVKVIP